MKIRILILFICSLLLSQNRVELNPDDSYSTEHILANTGEYLLNISASTDTDWSEYNNESSVLTVFIDGIYNQDIILYNGNNIHLYEQAVGYLESGVHSVELFFSYNKSSLNASIVNINDVELIDTMNINIDSKIFKYSPIIYGRNIFAWNESNHTDIPLLMYYEYEQGNLTEITYNIIFSNEDSRVGIGLSDMMLSWGRTTDIEWAYKIILNENEEIVSEIFQGAGHTPTEFNGTKYGTHPMLINATPNCNFDDDGSSEYKFFLSPLNTTEENHTREYLMDQNPWTYKIMGQELLNENKYENIQDPLHWELSDIRNYLYIEYAGSQSGGNIECKVQASFYDDCYYYSNNHNDAEIISAYGNGIQRTAIELPENFIPDNLQYLHFSSTGDFNYYIILEEITALFYLSDNYELIYLNIEDMNTPITFNEENPNNSFIINPQTLDYDCSGVLNGNAFCDDCGICSSGSTDNIPNDNLDDCGVCFGNNINMDCSGVCFGNAYIDECYVCDNNPGNDGESCSSGCTDINANNYDPDALLFDNNCEYSDNTFHVPGEYSHIQYAIFYASNFDTILVDPGTYYEELDFLGKGINLISTQGPESTIIVANANGNGDDGGVYEPDKSVITVQDTNLNEASIIGFTLKDGYGKGVNFEYFISVAADPAAFNDMMYNFIRSGGITVINSSITLSNLIIKENVGKNFGAGIGLVNSNSALNDILIENNHIPDGDALGGSGIAINGGVTSINNCIIKDNSVGSNFYQLNGGGGILCGFNFSEAPLELTVNNTEIYNNAANIGAAIAALSGNIFLNKTLIYNNTGEFGSAISLGEPLGLVIDDISMIITNSTIANNNGELSFGMIDNSNTTMINSILWNNGQFEFTPLPNNSLLNANVYYSDIRIIENIENDNSFSSNPLFNDYDNNDFMLSSSSPCIDTGIDTLIIDGQIILDMVLSEYTGIMPDMGYFEYNGTILGDINGDAITNILDIVLLVNIIFDQANEEYSLDITDLNQDGNIDILDIVLLVNIVLS